VGKAIDRLRSAVEWGQGLVLLDEDCVALLKEIDGAAEQSAAGDQVEGLNETARLRTAQHRDLRRRPRTTEPVR
jgi:hypothetical protein